MDDEIIIEPPKPPSDPNAPTTEEEAAAEVDQVFDVTPDLTISPVKDYGTYEVPSAPAAPAVEPAAPAAVPPPAPPPPPEPVPADVEAPAAPATPAAPRPIPIRDFSAALETARTAPANPPTKTVGLPTNFSSPESGGPTERPSLQSSIASEMPRRTDAIPPAAQTPADQAGGLKPIRTFEGDVAEVLSHKRTSTASIAIAESAKAGGEEILSTREPSHALRNVFFLILSLVIIGGGLYGAYYLYSQSPLAPSTEPSTAPAQAPTSLIPSDSFTTLETDGLSASAIISRVQAEVAKDQPSGTIKEIIPVTKENGVTLRLSATAMIDRMALPIPSVLKRSLEPNWMLGEYNDAAGNKSIFIVVTNNFFQNAFAGMLAWENVMADDIKQYLYIPPAAASPTVLAPSTLAAFAPAATSTAATTTRASTSTAAARQNASSTGRLSATSTARIATTSSSTPPTPTVLLEPNRILPPASTYFTIRGRFEDRIIGNKDVREFISTDGRVLFLYSFLDTSKLVVSGSEAALAEILARLEKKAFVR